MLSFRCIIHRAAAQECSVAEVELNGNSWPTLQVQQHDLAGFPLSFEQAFAALTQLERMFVEPDGSFVWVGECENQRWQLDGNLYDWGATLQYVELQGRCFHQQLDELLGCLGWPAVAMVFQLPVAGVYLAEADFRSYIATQSK